MYLVWVMALMIRLQKVWSHHPVPGPASLLQKRPGVPSQSESTSHPTSIEIIREMWSKEVETTYIPVITISVGPVTTT